MTDNRYRTAIKASHALGMLFCLMIFMLVIASLISELLLNKLGVTPMALRLQAITQDILVFILPPIVTALLSTRYPAELLQIISGPRLTTMLWAVATLVCSIPLMNYVIAWNDSWVLPESMAWARALEQAARQTTEVMLSGDSVGSLVVGLLIVGVLTGVAEELFFRGGIQKLLMCTRMNPHVAIWLTAAIFSVMHFQIYGLIPRMLLGALFGYAVWWSGSLWLSIILHAINNSLVVATTWLAARTSIDVNVDQIGVGGHQLPFIAASVGLTIVALYFMYRSSHLTQLKS